MSIAIGIDLGTTNTVVAAVVDGVAVTLEDDQGRRLLPSVVSFHPNGTVLVGDAARDRRLIDPENTIYSIKPLLGRPFASDEVQAALGRFPFAIVEGAKNATMVTARDVSYALPEISAFVLRRAKAVAEAALKQPVDRAVITVPANFNDLQRASTKIAGKLAGLEVMRILNEPTAAALAYGQSIARAEKIAVYDLGGGTFDVTLLDLTGNVFEVLATSGDSALGGDDIDRALADKMALEVIKRFNYDPRTNPVAFGRLRVLAEEVKKDLSASPHVTREIGGIGYTGGGVPITMPFSLSRDELDQLVLPFVDRTMAVAQQSIEIIGLSPKDFDRVILVGGSTRMPLVVRMVEKLFGQPPHLKVNPDEVVALGAAIQAHALNRSKAAKAAKPAPPRPATAQAPGAPHPPAPGAPPPAPGAQPPRPPGAQPPRPPGAPPAAPHPPPVPGLDAPPIPEFIAFSKAPAVITFSAPPGAPPPAPGAPPPVPGRPPVPGKPPPVPGKPPPVPARTAGPAGPVPPAPELELGSPFSAPAAADPPSDSRSLSGKTLGSIVAAGDFFPDADAHPEAPLELAYTRGSAIATAENAPLLIDVTPLSLRVETVGGYSDVLIAANSPVPCEKTRTFLTASDHQTMVFIRVAQGESARFAENTHLGDLELSGLKPATRGEVKILVTFELDADGILNVSAKDKETNRETKATMRLLGASTDAADITEMAARQARHEVA